MTAKEAYRIFKSRHPDKDACKCMEYESCFVFMLEGSDDKTLDCLLSVSKSNGLVRDFKPFHIPLEEYKNGKTISDFKMEVSKRV